MKRISLLVVSLVLIATSVLAVDLKMPPPPAIELPGVTPLPITAGFHFPAELKQVTHVVKTSPFDKVTYPVGEFSTQLLEKNLPAVFAKTVAVDSRTPAATVAADVVLELEVVRFEAVVPRPASNPYTATVVYRVDLFDREGNKLFSQTATGSGQTSKGMMSGFKAQSLCAEAAKLAMVDAAKQILEGLAEAEELRGAAPAAAAPADKPAVAPQPAAPGGGA